MLNGYFQISLSITLDRYKHYKIESYNCKNGIIKDIEAFRVKQTNGKVTIEEVENEYVKGELIKRMVH